MDSNIIKEELEKTSDVLKKYNSFLLKAKNVEEKVKITKDMYQYVKVISSKFYNEEEGKFQDFSEIINRVLLLETHLENQFIIDVKPNYELSSYLPKNYNEEMLLNYITSKARIRLIYLLDRFDTEDPLKCNLTEQCIPISEFIESECKNLGIYSKRYEICPGFTKTAHLHSNHDKHYFNIRLVPKLKK